MKKIMFRKCQRYLSGKLFLSGILILLCGISLCAQQKMGAHVKVFFNDGAIVKGELLAVKTGTIVVFDEGANQGHVIEAARIDVVKVLRPERVGIGIVAGAAAGYLLAYAVTHTGENEGFADLTYFFFPPLGTLVGGMFGSGMKWKTIPRDVWPDDAGEGDAYFLESLRRYAREGDGSEEEAGGKRRGWQKVLQRLHLNWNPVIISRGRLRKTQGEGTFRFTDGPDSERNELQTFSDYDEDFIDSFSFRNSLRVGVSYDFTPRLSGGVEYGRFENLETYQLLSLSFMDESSGKEYYAWGYEDYRHSLQTLMFGMEWNSGPLAPKRALRLSLRAMAGIARISLDRKADSILQSDQVLPIDRWSPSLSARLGCDINLGPILTARAFLEYYYAMASFPEIHERGVLEFESYQDKYPDVMRPIEITFPAHQYGFNGAMFGVGLTLTPFAGKR